jgi:SAM-dependent methyltransferase
VGFYRDRVFPRVMNRACNTAENRRLRQLACAPLAGDVLEIGFGTGLNLPHLPPAVTKLLAVEPLPRGRELAADRLAQTSVEVVFVGLDGQALPVEDACVDAALSTWTLCSIDDPETAVAEIARVLRPGGTFHFVEHGRSPDHKVQVWQDRLNGLQRRVACGCNLNREIPAIITAGGLTVTSLETSYLAGELKVLGWTFRGTARAG